jgi:hypothetical protein
MKVSKLNKEWHLGNKMPSKATFEERLKWHIEHSKNCACRPMPQVMVEELRKREK